MGEEVVSADGIAKVWKCCPHHTGKCHCGLGFGNQIRINHNGYFTFYAHLRKMVIKDKQKVRVGQIIGVAGNSGLAGNIHLHWALGREAMPNKLLHKKFIPFWSVEAKRVEIKEKGKVVSSRYFKKGKKYSSML